MERMPTGIEVLRESRMSRLVVSAGGMTWMKRRVVVTNEDILFSNVGCERVVDQISLVHVKRVAGMAHDPFKTSPIDLKDQVRGNGYDADKRCMIFINTVPDGVDEGIHTVLLAESVEKANEWVSLVSGLSRQAFHTMPQSRPTVGSLPDKKQQGFISMSSRPIRPQVKSMAMRDVKSDSRCASLLPLFAIPSCLAYNKSISRFSSKHTHSSTKAHTLTCKLAPHHCRHAREKTSSTTDKLGVALNAALAASRLHRSERSSAHALPHC